MKKLTILYCGWGERWRLGQLAHSGRRILFEYSPEALERGLEPSRLRVPLRREAYADLPEHLHLLPGFIADALPDGWGWLLMDRVFQRNGIDPAAVSPLDRLALLGERAMGALAFEPATNQVLTTRDTTLLKLARQVERFSPARIRTSWRICCSGAARRTAPGRKSWPISIPRHARSIRPPPKRTSRFCSSSRHRTNIPKSARWSTSTAKPLARVV